MFEKKEIGSFIISVIVLSLIFGFDDKQSVFNLNHWLINLVRIAILVIISLLVHELAHKLLARYHGCKAESRVWGIQQIGFKKTAKIMKLPLGILLPLIVMLLSKGQLFFAAINQTSYSTMPEERLGKKYPRLMNYEMAKFAAAGPIASILFALLIKSLGISQISDLITINIALAVSNVLPFPRLDGSECLFGSKTLFIFTFFFVIISAILINALSSFTTLVISLLLAALFLGIISYSYIFTKS